MNKYLVNVDTVAKQTGVPFNCTVLFTQHHRRVRAVSLKNAQSPVGFYNIRSPYNTFTANSTTYTVAPGNYTITGLMTTLSSSTGLTFANSYSNNTVSVTGSNAITVYTKPNPPDLGTLLGFSNATVSVSTGSNASNIATSQACFNINPDMYINIWLQNIGTSSQETTQCSFKLPLNNVINGIMHWNESGQNICKIDVTDSSVIIDRLIITVTDRYGNILNNNGLDWSMTLEIEADN